MSEPRIVLINRMVDSSANLDAMHSVVCAMESGRIRGTLKSADRIIAIAKAEMQRQYQRYAKARAALLKAKP